MKTKAITILFFTVLITFKGHTEPIARCNSTGEVISCIPASVSNEQYSGFFASIFDTSKWPPRWQCGSWSAVHGWTYILSDIGIWLAYFAIPIILGFFLYKKNGTGLPFSGIMLLFMALILSCGLTHLIDAVIFWQPVYKLSAMVRFLTAVISIGTVFALIKVAPRVIQYRSPQELEKIVEERTEALKRVNQSLEKEISEKEAVKKEGRLLLESLPIIAWGADPLGESTYVNGRWKEYTGLESNDDESWRKTVHPDDLKIGEKLWKHCVKTGQDFILEQRLAAKDGHYEWFLIKAIAIKDDQGNIIKWIGTDTNIHEQKESEHRKDIFLNIASHELRTPLTSVKAYIELLREILGEHKFEPVPSYLDKAYRSTEKLNALISELLDVSRIQSGKVVLNKSEFDIDDMVQDVIEIFQHDTPTHEIAFDGGMDNLIIADRGRVEQIVNNLLSNAIKYSPKANKVIIRTIKGTEHVRIDVVDFGVGIPVEEQDKLFDQFYRSSDAAKSANGLGMGLYISQEIAKQHGGIIKVKSTLGEGATFSLILPFSQQN
ncbi:PAS domain-containing protein [Fulvivirga sp. 29W222]|uniref:histidine kinase n=1 Tax=Fulvivirga marina TaxID=2494733 RepID=A0A937FZG7_9BACT|nr:PAS domain-containing sensor histidine kinase [Fulvivirga marina]MBL6448859.1 PAS domain-containing protein [Fulvivirga marina]